MTRYCVSFLAAFAFASLLPRAAFPQAAPPENFSGTAALNFAARVVDFGPRPSGSAANTRQRAYIHEQLATCLCDVSNDTFTAQTPDGPVAMENIIAKFPG